MDMKKILLPTDFSECSDAALNHALFLARHFGAELDFLHVVVLHAEDPFNPAAHFPDTEEIYRRLKDVAANEMREQLAARQPGELKIREEQRRAIAAAPAIVEYAAAEGIDLIVMGAHGRRGFRRFLLGSVTEEVVRLAPCPVLTLRGTDEPPEVHRPARIVVPFDFSDHSRSAFTAAKELVANYGGTLQVVHIIEPPMDPEIYVPLHDRMRSYAVPQLADEVREALHLAIDNLGGNAVDCRVAILEGSAGAEIAEYAESQEADLIVIATHGLTGLRRLLLGSVAEKVVRLASCPVLTFKTREAAAASQAAAAA